MFKFSNFSSADENSDHNNITAQDHLSTTNASPSKRLLSSQVVVDMVVIDAMIIKTKGEYILFVILQRQYHLICMITDALCL